MKYLWDTHAWIWASLGSPRLGKAAARLGNEIASAHAIADISLWEAAMLIECGKVPITVSIDEWISRASESTSILPITPAIAARSAGLKWPHADPADRLIVATAIEHKLSLVSADRAITLGGLVPIVW